MTKRAYHRLLAALEPDVRRAFERAVADLAAAPSLARLEAALASGDIDAALAILDIDEAAFDGFREALRSAFREGGTAEAQALNATAPTFAVRFALGNPLAEQLARELGSTLIRQITDETRQQARRVIADGIAQGVNPRSTARLLVGVHDPPTGRRVGGILGLTAQQNAWVGNAADELSGEPPSANYLQRQARDRRFDSTVRKAIREGKAIPEAQRAMMVRRYRARLLKLRGETIARTESIAALNGGRYEATRQMVERGLATPDRITLTWSDSRDALVRDLHRAMNGQQRRFGEPFVSPTGALLRYPGGRIVGGVGG